MKRYSKTMPTVSVLALAILSVFLLPSCSSGGGGAGTVRIDPPPPPAPPPPAPPPPTTPPAGQRSLELPTAPPPKTAPAAPPVNSTGNVVRIVDTGMNDQLFQTSSDGSLTKLGGGLLFLPGVEYRFDGGVFVEAGTLSCFYSSLFSDVTIAAGATLDITGDIIGDVENHGILDPTEEPAMYDAYYEGDIFGDYHQYPEAALRVSLGLQGSAPATPLLTISGTATLSGSLLLQPYYTTSSGYLEWIVHAGGGVIGQFDRWTTPMGSPYFIFGELRYGPNDVYLLTSRVSTQSVMAAAGVGDALTLSTALNVDNAFGVADALASSSYSGLTEAQRQFLWSSASIQQIADYDQALSTFDSLSGHGHIDAIGGLLQQAMGSGQRLGTHFSSLRGRWPSGAWTTQAAMASAGAGTFTHSPTSGYDLWLGDRLVVGSTLGWTRGSFEIGREGGRAYSASPQWSAYLRRNGDNASYLMADVGYSHQRLGLDRPIDLGNGRHYARSERNLGVTHAYLESGRELQIGRGQLTSFAALGHAALRSDGFFEQGDTGFELMALPSVHRRTTGDIGLRYARNWRWSGEQWLQLDLGAGWQRLLGAGGEMRGAFTGAPSVEFDLAGLSRETDTGWLNVNFTGGASERWSWLLNYDRRTAGDSLSFGVGLEF